MSLAQCALFLAGEKFLHTFLAMQMSFKRLEKKFCIMFKGLRLHIDFLVKVDLPLVSDSQCREGYGQDLIFDSMMCAGYENGGKDACQVNSLILNFQTHINFNGDYKAPQKSF